MPSALGQRARGWQLLDIGSMGSPRLVRQAIEDAQSDRLAIIPLCPFAKVQIGRHPEWQDVVRRS